MGAALSSHAKWTSTNGRRGKLEYLPENETLLGNIVHYLNTVCRDHPSQAGLVFKTAFKWRSTIHPDLFKSGGDDMPQHEIDLEGNPVFFL